VVFGSDYPFHDYPVELQKVYVAGLTEAQKEWCCTLTQRASYSDQDHDARQIG